ncbi:MAG: hypothetical protein WCV68_01865 [Candidatus Paceibacterota bacterium]|jgi:hypothetical protein
MAEKPEEKSFEEVVKGELVKMRQSLRWISDVSILVFITLLSVIIFQARWGVEDKAVLAELQSIHRGQVIQYKEDHLYLTYDDLSSGHYKVVHVVNGSDGTALLQIPGPHGYGERVVRKIPLELLVEGKEFDIDGTFSPKLNDPSQ